MTQRWTRFAQVLLLIPIGVVLLGTEGRCVSFENRRMILDLQEAVCKKCIRLGLPSPEFCEEPGETPVCEQPREVGPCLAVIPRWHFDADAEQCLPFNYGGCQGNDNNFLTQAECESACDSCGDLTCRAHQVCRRTRTGEPYCADTCERVRCAPGTHCELKQVQCVVEPCPPVAQCVPDPGPDCASPIDVGPCLASIPRWGYNPATGECERFNYGGCGGNQNNYLSLELCENACVGCEGFACDDHQVCKLFDPCRDGTCPQQPYCADTCEGFPCAAGEQCELIDVLCVQEPCPPIAQCIPRRLSGG